MKEYKYLYRKMLDKKVIQAAYKRLRKGKTKRPEIQFIDAQERHTAGVLHITMARELSPRTS